MTTNQKLRYNVDICFCIEVTNTMFGVLDVVKSNVSKIIQFIKNDIEKQDRYIDNYRVKVIAFRDFDTDKENSLEILDFVKLPEKQEEFLTFVDKLRATGGKTGKSNGLEALAMAMNSDWSKEGDRRRHIIVVFSSSSTHPIEKKSEYKPDGMPINFEEMTDWWERRKMEGLAKRLVILAPETEFWTDIATHWEQVIHYPSRAGNSLSDEDYKTIFTSGISEI